MLDCNQPLSLLNAILRALNNKDIETALRLADKITPLQSSPYYPIYENKLSRLAEIITLVNKSLMYKYPHV